MVKKIGVIILSICMVFGLVGCNASTSSTISYTFSVDTGDSVKITLDTSDKYSLTSELPFSISCDGELLSQGIFITAESYSQYAEVVETDENATLIDSGTKDGNEYIFWSYNGSEYNYAILIADSNTGIIMGNTVSEESAKECFERIKVSAK